MKELLALKAEYKKVTGQDWKPGAAPPAAAPVAAAPVAAPLAAAPPASTGSDLDVKITAQGNKVRELKANKASKVSNASTDIPYIPVFFFNGSGISASCSSSFFYDFPLASLYMVRRSSRENDLEL